MGCQQFRSVPLRSNASSDHTPKDHGSPTGPQAVRHETPMHFIPKAFRQASPWVTWATDEPDGRQASEHQVVKAFPSFHPVAWGDRVAALVVEVDGGVEETQQQMIQFQLPHDATTYPSWSMEIQQTIHSCSIFLLFISPSFATSWPLRRQLRQALYDDKPIRVVMEIEQPVLISKNDTILDKFQRSASAFLPESLVDAFFRNLFEMLLVDDEFDRQTGVITSVPLPQAYNDFYACLTLPPIVYKDGLGSVERDEFIQQLFGLPQVIPTLASFPLHQVELLLLGHPWFGRDQCVLLEAWLRVQHQIRAHTLAHSTELTMFQPTAIKMVLVFLTDLAMEHALVRMALESLPNSAVVYIAEGDLRKPGRATSLGQSNVVLSRALRQPENMQTMIDDLLKRYNGPGQQLGASSISTVSPRIEFNDESPYMLCFDQNVQSTAASIETLNLLFNEYMASPFAIYSTGGTKLSVRKTRVMFMLLTKGLFHQPSFRCALMQALRNRIPIVFLEDYMDDLNSVPDQLLEDRPLVKKYRFATDILSQHVFRNMDELCGSSLFAYSYVGMQAQALLVNHLVECLTDCRRMGELQARARQIGNDIFSWDDDSDDDGNEVVVVDGSGD